MAARGKINSKYQGMNWCAPAKRLAIYLRDGLACAYCGQGIENSARLTLDHIVPFSASGKSDNRETNLVTACLQCNSGRGNRDLSVFCHTVAQYLDHGVSGQEIYDHVQSCLARPIDRKEAKAIIDRRGGFSLALSGFRG